MVRQTTEGFADEAEVALAQVLESLELTLVAPDDDADLAVDLGGGRVVQLNVRALSLADPSRVRSLLARTDRVDRNRRNGPVPLLVADTITAGARKLLADSGWGWFDRRGHLYLRAPGARVDASVPRAPRRDGGELGAPIVGTAGLAAALALLLRPEDRLPVRATAAEAELNPSSISRAVARLRDHLLVGADNRPAVPELFWALADVWPRRWAQLKRRPRPEDASALAVNAEDLDGPGSALTGTRAAAAWDAPIVTGRSPIVELLVPGEAVLRRARQRLGDAVTPGSAATVIRVAPAGNAIRHRGRVKGERLPVAHPVVVALDLAGDLSRGIEILEKWTPPSPFTRVW